jgi:hypothetical protein
MNLRKLLAALFAALLLVGACSSGDDSDDSASDTTEDESTDTTEESSDSGDDSGDSDADLEDLADLDEDCLTASGAAISLGLMPLMFAFAPMGEAFTDDTLFTEADAEEINTSIEDLKDAVPDELSDDVETLADMTSDAFEDPESFDETEWEKAMEGINTYLEEECGGAFDDLEGDLGDLESDLEDLSDISIPELTIPE